MDIKIIVATHKKYWMPEDDMYFPVRLGANGNDTFGYQGDNTGDNISYKKENYCELSGLYWAWKNLDSEYIGLVHYRRHFSVTKGRGDKKTRVITKTQLEALLKNTDIILPKIRNYYIETTYNQYIHAHHAQDLDETRNILLEKYPEYIEAFDETMNSAKGHRFNMMIMKKTELDQYCRWLFDVLFELEKRIDITGYSENDKRVFGFVGERLMDVWLKTNQKTYKDIPYLFMEKQNWVKKVWNFLNRKFRGNN